MPPAVRRSRILERIQRDGGVSVAELARDHDVSPITVHRDLEQLAREGLVERVHGGARAIRGTQPIATAWTARRAQASAAKATIAEHAVHAVDESSTIFLDSSSTCLALARRLMEDPPNGVTLVTNSPAIALGLTASSIHVIVAPGELDQHMRVLTGRWTVDFLAHLNFAAAFVSAAGVTLDHGLTTSRSGLADTLNAAADSAKQAVALMDSTKFERSSLMTIRRAEALDLIITDDRLDPAVAAAFRAAGVNLQVVSGVAAPSDADAD